MANIETTIQKIAQNFVQEVVKALVGSSIEEFAQLAHKGGSRAARSAPAAPKPAKRGRSAKAEKASTRGRKPAKRNRRSSGEIEIIKNKVIECIRDSVEEHPNGISVSEIAKAIREDIEDITRPIHQAVEAGQIKKKGQKRLTRYFPGKKAD
jgi:ribosomal protein L12E/L44/L45/RPP1/RPP2